MSSRSSILFSMQELIGVCAYLCLPIMLVGCDSGGDSVDDDSEANSGRSLRLVNAVTRSVTVGWEISESDQGTVAQHEQIT